MIEIKQNKIADKETGKEIAKALEQGISKDTFSIKTTTLDSMSDATGTDSAQIIEIRRLLLLIINNGKGQ